MPWRRNEAAAVEITALAAGAGPPANKMATRRIDQGEPDEVAAAGSAEVMSCSKPK